jgi:flavin reductase (DIM6/NTAB) family NADH-FMN oxidoreductase RutF
MSESQENIEYAQTILSLTNHEVYTVSAQYLGEANGQIATWIIPASLAAGETRILVCISKFNYTYEFIRQSGRFAVAMLAEAQSDLVPLFGLYSGRDKDKLSGIDIETTPSGIPVPAGTCGWIDCTIREHMDTGDRMIYLAEGTASQLYAGCKPLRKQEAFAALPEDIRDSLIEKQLKDGKRDAGYIRYYNDR